MANPTQTLYINKLTVSVCVYQYYSFSHIYLSNVCTLDKITSDQNIMIWRQNRDSSIIKSTSSWQIQDVPAKQYHIKALATKDIESWKAY